MAQTQINNPEYEPDKIMCEKLKEEVRSLDLMFAAFAVFSIPFIMLMRIVNIFTDQLAGNMLIGTLFAVAFFAMPVMMIHAATANCNKE